MPAHGSRSSTATNGRPSESGYEPTLSFSLDSTQAVPQTKTSEDTNGGRVVHASAPGHLTTPTLQPSTIHLLGRDVPVRWLRAVATGLALLMAAVAALAAARARRHRHAGLESLTGRLVTAANIDLGARAVIDINDADSLARLAARYDTAVIHIPRPEGDLYHVVVDDTIYRYARPAEHAGSHHESLRRPHIRTERPSEHR